MKALSVLIVIGLTRVPVFAEPRMMIDLNGQWEFDQTTNAFPPRTFTRTIPVPGLIDLAEPRIEQYDACFTGQYEPRYSWYRRRFHVPAEYKDKYAVLSILKSMYGTRVYLNGIEVGSGQACFTPIELPVGRYLRFGDENELMIRLGERQWMPLSMPGGYDGEKKTYIPGIWDDVYLSFTGLFRIDRLLALPDVDRGKLIVKMRMYSFEPVHAWEEDTDLCDLTVEVHEKSSGKRFLAPVTRSYGLNRSDFTVVAFEMDADHPHLWSPEDPFLYTVTVTSTQGADIHDRVRADFGMRDFKVRGRFFWLNGEKYILRGTNITLHRFFEDRQRGRLPWTRSWVTRLLHDIPKSMQWNAMRVCVGIAPRFWYDIADHSGLLLQNEWQFWEMNGWDEQIRKEYTEWVWADGNHPSIVIWDAINENSRQYINRTLIPELKQLDPTRVWDNGYCWEWDTPENDMDEPHPYIVNCRGEDATERLDKLRYTLGDLHWPLLRRFTPRIPLADMDVPQVVNEYGWVWLTRDGQPSEATRAVYKYYVGTEATPEQRRAMQAYWLQCQTEWLRTERSLAGILCFCYLTNSPGATGDWFVGDIAELQPGPSLEWLRHGFAPAAVFLDLPDYRYTKHLSPLESGGELVFNLVGVNDHDREIDGQVALKLLNAEGDVVVEQNITMTIPPYGKKYQPTEIRLPQKPGGYLMLALFSPHTNQPAGPAISRRYLKIGRQESYVFYEYPFDHDGINRWDSKQH